MTTARSRAERDGQRGERLAALYLRAKGWRILQRQVRVGQGRGVGGRARVVMTLPISHVYGMPPGIR